MLRNYRSFLAFKRFRALIVWAMMPLSVVNGQAIVGCGCTGHFETACHCLSCDSSSAAGQPARNSAQQSVASHAGNTQACCCAHHSASAPKDHESSSTSASSGFMPHQCTSQVLRLGESVIAVSPQISDQVDVTISRATLLDLPATFAMDGTVHAFSFDSGPPPCDYVVTLRRLII
jgi:hypothetical protein